MKTAKNLFSVLIATIALNAALMSAAQAKVKIVSLKDNTKIYTDTTIGKADQPVFVLVNGLIYDTHRWDPMAKHLIQKGYTVVRYAFRAQPENLRLLKKDESPAFLSKGFTLDSMAEELDQVLVQLGITEPVNLVGLSYGATVAVEFAKNHPEKVANTILISPLVVPLDYYHIQGQSLRAWLNSVRFWENSYCSMYGVYNPFLCQNEDHWYDAFYNYFYENFLDQRVDEVPENIDADLYKKSIFHLVRAVRDFNLNKYVAELHNVHLWVASEDNAALLKDQLDFWGKLPEKSRLSLLTIKGAKHAIPDEAPVETAEWLEKMALDAPEVQAGVNIEVEITP